MKFSEPALLEIKNRWLSLTGSRYLVERDNQEKYIEFCREKYPYPDYLELVGPPSDQHYNESGQLTVERKAQLMLIGVYRWKDYWIAKQENCDSYDEKGWLVLSKHDPEEELQLFDDRLGRPFKKTQAPGKWIAGKRGGEKEYWRGDRGYFDPSWRKKPQRLEQVLVGSEYAAIFQDGNPYNCAPDNLGRGNKKGRSLRCKRCQRRTAKEFSKVVNLDGQRFRFCMPCIREMAKNNDLPVDFGGVVRVEMQ